MKKKKKAEKLPKAVHVYAKCVAWSYDMSPYVMKGDTMYDCIIFFVIYLFVQLSVPGQLGSNNHGLVMCFTHNCMHADGCISAGV